MAGLTKEQKAERALQAKAIELSGLKAEEFALLSDEEKAAHTTKAQEAFDEEAKRIADEKAAVDAAKDSGKAPDVDDSHLIEVAKDGETLKVHPTCLTAHRLLGWKEA